MKLARDEAVGLTVAGLVAVLALASFVYRATRSTTPAAPPAATPVNDQAARAAYAELLDDVFEQDQNPATITADGTTLVIAWDMCSKQMLQRLLHDDKHEQVSTIRRLSGISVKRLRSHGFTKVSCDDGRKGLTPAVEKL